MKRARGSAFTVPVVHGSYAVHLGDNGTEARTHRWVVYLRPYHPALISHFIQQVEFVLHDSFSPQTRKISEMPYEVHEHGWGEFEVVIRVVFHDASEKPVEFFHPLLLFHNTEANTSPAEANPSPEPVVHEFYDEIVFQDPTEKMLNLLKHTPHGTHVRLKPSIYTPFQKDYSNSENDTLKSIEHARKRLRDETLKKQERYEQLEEERAALVRQINSLGGRAM